MRRRLAVIVALAVALITPHAMATPDEARAWLQRMTESLASRNYDGLFTHSTGTPGRDDAHRAPRRGTARVSSASCRWTAVAVKSCARAEEVHALPAGPPRRDRGAARRRRLVAQVAAHPGPCASIRTTSLPSARKGSQACWVARPASSTYGRKDIYPLRLPPLARRRDGDAPAARSSTTCASGNPIEVDSHFTQLRDGWDSIPAGTTSSPTVDAIRVPVGPFTEPQLEPPCRQLAKK